MGQEIREALLYARRESRETMPRVQQEVWEAAPVQNIAPRTVVCPWCGASAHPDVKGCCEHCGGPIDT